MRRRFFTWLARQLVPHLRVQAGMITFDGRGVTLYAGDIESLGTPVGAITADRVEHTARPSRRFIGRQ